jgi:alpha-2-macroglobulin family protein
MNRSLRFAGTLAIQLAGAALALATACRAKEQAPQVAAAPPPADEPVEREVKANNAQENAASGAAPVAQSGVLEDRKAGLKVNLRAAAKLDAGGGGHAPEGPTRAWFPETFLFEPLVVTDDHGAAVVPVRVPDRLTTWRVLALAHSRTGAQGGAVTSFLGTLPAYVDPVVPPFLVQGDEVRVPIQLVNTTAGDVAGRLEVTAVGATLRGGAGGARTVPAQGSTLDHAMLVAERPGRVTLRFALAGSDAVERSFEVRPSGRPVSRLRSGTLAASQLFKTLGTPGADPTTDHVRLLVFPGALALLRSELSVSSARSELADDAYALLLAGRAPTLLAALGDKPDLAALRELAILAGQRAIRDARTFDVERAALLAEPAAVHPGNPVLARLGQRAAAYLAQVQRPDGTFSGATGWTLQRLLVVTAEATRAITAAQTPQTPIADRQRAQQVQTRAAGAFLRNADQVTDGYTAAAMLASGAVTGDLAQALRDRVRKAIHSGDNGAKYLDVPDGVVRPDGAAPSRIEATALAVLALETDRQAPLADLGTTLLGGYSVARGWGDGRTNLVAMRAVLALFKDPVPSSVSVTLAMDGAPILRGTLEGARLRDVLVLDGAAPGLAEPHEFTLSAEPAVPGLGYSLELDSFVAWDKPAAGTGLELAVPAQVDAAVGKPVAIAVTASAPAGLPLHIHQALPAGVQVDAPSLEAQVAAGAIQKFTASDGGLDLDIAGLAPGKTVAVSYRAIATLAGTLHTGPSQITAGGQRYDLPPATWTVK